jgi:hypothetical protein
MIICVGNQKSSSGTSGQFGLKPIARLLQHPSAKADGNEFSILISGGFSQRIIDLIARALATL